jgi:hypothetical protein
MQSQAEYIRRTANLDAEELEAALEILSGPEWMPKVEPAHGEPWFTLPTGSDELPRAA